MKLLQISIEVNSGSVGRIAEQIGQKAIDCGWDSYIAYARNKLALCMMYILMEYSPE
mgnify:CR=1 FL=1